MLSRTLKNIFALVAAAIILVSVLNVGGWRARLLARLFRVENQPLVVPPPPNFQPKVPAGFNVSVFARGFAQPRWLAVAPNGDVFVADPADGKVIALHDPHSKGSAESQDIFADQLNLPFGIAFHDDFVYVANTNEVVRFRYDPKTSKRLGEAEHILDLPGMGYHQHWTRSLAFSPEGKKLFTSVGSSTNVSVENDTRRAAILVSDPDGKNARVYASGLRNAVGIAFQFETGALWATVNERDDIADDVPADYFTHVTDGGFYGWPYTYNGNHPDNRVPSKPELLTRTIAPDLTLGAHVAPLQFAFYDKQSFPAEYRQGAFIAEHGSWNRRVRSGYQVVFVPFTNGSPSGAPKPFLSGFVPDATKKEVYGRLVGVAVAADGALLVSDDAEKLIWRISYSARTPN
ncbi:MAG TPA: sorbosone dehydrogenase family protein [Candidatus Sulfotelmatobacter sp.]|nr:sorbosone dehydrogenase family protein [Candidatus Sulfotelmatobacter sp.]